MYENYIFERGLVFECHLMNCFSSFAFNVNWRRYVTELKHCRLAMIAWLGILAQAVSTNPEVRRCSLTGSKLVLKAPMVSALEIIM
jgi:hypothetical protein